MNELKVQKNTKENRYKLAKEVVDSWDMATLLEYAIDILEANYKGDDDQFETDWNDLMEEDSE